MSSGHGALHFFPASSQCRFRSSPGVRPEIDRLDQYSLGSGFRGGFFSQPCSSARRRPAVRRRADPVWAGLALDSNVMPVIGMSALSASVVGGPLTDVVHRAGIDRQSLVTTAVLVG